MLWTTKLLSLLLTLFTGSRVESSVASSPASLVSHCFLKEDVSKTELCNYRLCNHSPDPHQLQPPQPRLRHCGQTHLFKVTGRLRLYLNVFPAFNHSAATHPCMHMSPQVLQYLGYGLPQLYQMLSNCSPKNQHQFTFQHLQFLYHVNIWYFHALIFNCEL